MKEKIITAAGRAWWALGEKGQARPQDLAKALKENEGVVQQAIGWLAREDKIEYSEQRNKIYVSLVAKEMTRFRELYQDFQDRAEITPKELPKKKFKLF